MFSEGKCTCSDRRFCNVLVVIEGFTMYLCEGDIRQMFSIIEKTFPKVTVMVENMSPFVVQHVKEKSIEGSNARFTWGVKNGKELQRILPSFICREEISLVEGMKVLMPVYHVLGKIPAVYNLSNKIMILEKCPAGDVHNSTPNHEIELKI